jgi:hypothetical protein
MKKELITEAFRMQQLAGILNENENIEALNDLEVGDVFRVVKSPDSKIMQFLKSAFSAFYDKNIQPQVGDEFEILPNEFKKLDNIYIVKNLNRPNEFIKVLGPISTEAIVSMPKIWVDALYSKGYFKKIY